MARPLAVGVKGAKWALEFTCMQADQVPAIALESIQVQVIFVPLQVRDQIQRMQVLN